SCVSPSLAEFPVRDQFSGEAPRFDVCPQYVIQAVHGPYAGHFREHGLTDPRYAEKVQAPPEEGLDGHLVRGVENRRLQATGPGRRLRQRKAAETLHIGCAEFEARSPDEVEEFYTGGEPLRPPQRIGDGSAHVR